MQNKERYALLVLLRAGLWEKQPDELSCFSLGNEGWDGVFRLARQQTVTGLAFQGLQYLPSGLLPPEPLLMRWAAAVEMIERSNRKMEQVLAGLVAMFQAEGLNPVLQKGQGVARFYEHPLLRECGDIDFYFNGQTARDKALSCVQQARVRTTQMPDHSVCYQWKGVCVEHHSCLLDLSSPFLQRMARRMEETWGYVRCPLSGVEVSVPAPFLNLLLLDLHILKHALGRGIGLRQLCDMARACHCLHDELSADEMKTACVRLGLGRWNPLLHAFLVDCLGLPTDSLPYPERAASASPLLDIVWRGGNFGQHLAGRRERDARSTWMRKWQTCQSFLHNVGFSCRYAPKETFWMMARLSGGQLLSFTGC